jgi:hypothetical protein
VVKCHSTGDGKRRESRAMLGRCSSGMISLVVTISVTSVSARAHDESKYPDLKGQWIAVGVNADSPWDPTKPAGRGQQAPLTPEYQAIFETTLTRYAEAGRPPATCIPPGMPRAMIGYRPMEIIVMPYATNIMLGEVSEIRRIYTDGRKWPEELEPAHPGYSIGTWEDTDGDGRYDTLIVETRSMKGPRTFDSSGLPLHQDNRTVVKERINLDKINPDLLHDEITTTDNALTRPWTVTRTYQRTRNPEWDEFVCSEHNRHVAIGAETYAISNDDRLMPTRKGQPPPDLHYFPNRK